MLQQEILTLTKKLKVMQEKSSTSLPFKSSSTDKLKEMNNKLLLSDDKVTRLQDELLKLTKRFMMAGVRLQSERPLLSIRLAAQRDKDND